MNVSSVDNCRNQIKEFPGGNPVAIWSDSVLLKVSEVIGSIMKERLGKTLTPSSIKKAVQPVIIGELMSISNLAFPVNDGDQGKFSEAFGRVFYTFVSLCRQPKLMRSVVDCSPRQDIWKARRFPCHRNIQNVPDSEPRKGSQRRRALGIILVFASRES